MLILGQKGIYIYIYITWWHCYKVIGGMGCENVLIHIPLETLKTQHGLGGSYKRLKKRQCIC